MMYDGEEEGPLKKTIAPNGMTTMQTSRSATARDIRK
jgi:hypothetical protein